MTWSTDPSVNVLTNPKKNPRYGRSFNILWLKLNKIGGISILQSAHKQSNPLFHFHAPGSKSRYPCTHTASAVPKLLPCLLQFCTGYRIWHASRVWKRKTSEKSWFTQLKNIQIQPTRFRYFWTDSYKMTSDLFTVVWPVRHFLPPLTADSLQAFV